MGNVQQGLPTLPKGGKKERKHVSETRYAEKLRIGLQNKIVEILITMDETEGETSRDSLLEKVLHVIQRIPPTEKRGMFMDSESWITFLEGLPDVLHPRVDQEATLELRRHIMLNASPVLSSLIEEAKCMLAEQEDASQHILFQVPFHAPQPASKPCAAKGSNSALASVLDRMTEAVNLMPSRGKNATAEAATADESKAEKALSHIEATRARQNATNSRWTGPLRIPAEDRGRPGREFEYL